MDTLADREEPAVSNLVDRVVDTFSAVYGNKFLGRTDEYCYLSLRKGWEWAVRPFSEETLSRAVARVLEPGPYDKQFDWPPNPQEFFTLCKSMDPSYKKLTQPRSEATILSKLLKNIDIKAK